ncbi:MAG: threonine synthase [Saprospiraceae bacterium]|nr:threonine synthase [Saprospiraceae bacterium]
MLLYSTNNHKNKVSLKEAVLNAFPPDRGLYLPARIPKLNDNFIASLKDHSFQEISFEICRALFQSYIPDESIRDIVYKAITFPAPVIKLDEHISTLELFHGPTMAFKDFGARFMAGLMSYFLKDEDRETTILVATSGDTGGAVASGFYDVEGINVIILYPSGKISPLQEKQLTTWGKNIQAIEVAGVFDDCQRLVKEAFLDEDLRDRYTFSSANSINIARLIPQSFYYFEAFKQLSDYKDVVFSVPSGNFGNITAGYIARLMGLPVSYFIASVNNNTTFYDYMKTGVYRARPSVPTLSNAMDVGDPSNFPRLLQLTGSTWNLMKEHIKSYHFSDNQTRITIKDIYEKYNYIPDPHGAVGFLACQQNLLNDQKHHVFLETAHPAKFSETVEETLGLEITLPVQLRAFITKEKNALQCSSHYSNFKKLLMNL